MNDSNLGDECLGLIRDVLENKERDLEDDLTDYFIKKNLWLDGYKLCPG